MTESEDIKKVVVVTLILALFILAFFVVKPIIMPIIFGLLFSYVFGPVYKVILVNLPSLLFQLAVFLFTFYFATKDADKLGAYISSLSPFSKATEAKFLQEFRGITNAIIFGQILIGITQGLALGAGLFFLGVPNAVVLTAVAALVSIIPVLGSC